MFTFISNVMLGFKINVREARRFLFCLLSIHLGYFQKRVESHLLLGFVIQTLYLYVVTYHFPVGSLSVCESE